ncbi:hypothetical protein AB2B38_007970 [Balneola sp. MJW-20]|uniref:hypothetical protein n=1 Tax=Gracilimonas aurantiaca TaxID=3234185 RepID=UPI0034672C41
MKKLTRKELWLDLGIIASLIILSGLLMMGIKYYGIYQFNGTWEKYVIPNPSVVVKSISVITSINKFAGDPSFTPEFLTEHYIPNMIAVGSSLIFTFLLVPYIFIKALKALKSGKRNLVYYFGTTLMVFVLGWNMIGLPRTVTTSFQTVESANQSREMDRAREYLANAAYLAAKELVMNYRYDVSGKSDSEYKLARNLGENLSPRLQDIEKMDTDRFDLVIDREASDSSLVLHLVLDQESDKSNYENINGEKGKKELIIEVDPNKERFFRSIRSNSY